MVSYTTLFLDIGGVFLTNGWDHTMRERAAHVFDLDFEEMNKRHALTFDTYESGKITLDEYIKRVVFYKARSFSVEEFKAFMFDQSKPYPDMIELFKTLKKNLKLKIVTVSNEGRELMQHRIEAFKLREWIDIFVCSAFVHLRKPDDDIYYLALDLAQVHPSQVVYIDDRPMLVEIGKKIGMQAILHQTFEETNHLLQGFFP